MRITLKVLLLLTSAYYLNSCGSAASSTTSTSPASVAPTPNANGELVTTVNAETGATISASALSNDPLSQYTSVEIPAGALSKATEVKMFETGSLASQITPTDFGSVTEITKAGPTIVIQATDVTLTADVTISVPYDASLSLVQPELAVVVLDGTSLEIVTGDQITVGSKTVSIKIRHFGAFQVVKYTGTVTQKSATVEISSGTLSSMQWVGGCFNGTDNGLPDSWRNSIAISDNRLKIKTTVYTGLNCLTESYWSTQASSLVLGTNTITWTMDTLIIPASLGAEKIPCSTTWKSVGDTLECRVNDKSEFSDTYKISDNTFCFGDTMNQCLGGSFGSEIKNAKIPVSRSGSSVSKSGSTVSRTVSSSSYSEFYGMGNLTEGQTSSTEATEGPATEGVGRDTSTEGQANEGTVTEGRQATATAAASTTDGDVSTALLEGTWSTNCHLSVPLNLNLVAAPELLPPVLSPELSPAEGVTYVISILVISSEEITVTKNLYSTDACTESTSNATVSTWYSVSQTEITTANSTDEYQINGDQLIFYNGESSPTYADIEHAEMYYRQ